MKHEIWRRVAHYTGRELGDAQLKVLDAYSTWLTTEASRAGGIGPTEANRVGERHIGDSLTFAYLLPDSHETVWDLGSGVGLPGVPLAILLPETQFRLVDRSGKRIDLLRRAIRVLDLQNVAIQQADIADLHGLDLAVSRAASPPEEMARLAAKWLNPGGIVIQGGSWREKPCHTGWETHEIPDTVLDYPVWLLIMRRR